MAKKMVDMTSGPILKKIIIFIIPLILSNLLQQLYNTADMIVAGRFAGVTALAAIGATGSLYNLIVNFLTGLSVGASTVVAQNQGAEDKEGVNRAVHTSIAIALLGGIIVAVAGIILCRPMLRIMETPENVIDHSVLYMRIIFAGVPIVMVYNFGAAILRAKGDTKRPLVILGLSGLVNVILNIIFVVVFGMGVEGVAIPTVISQLISAIMVIKYLIKEEGPYRLFLKKIHIWKDQATRIISIGIPVGIQSTLFSFTNILIQSSINSFGSMGMAGVAAHSKITAFLTVIFNSVSQANTVFCGQNFGAKKYDRMIKVILCCGMISFAMYLILAPVFIKFSRPLLSLFTTEEEAIKFGIEAMTVMVSTRFIGSFMNIMASALRAMNKSFISMFNSLFCLIAIRLYWVLVYFPAHRTMTELYISYPLTWAGTFVLQTICFIYFYRKLKKQ